MINGLRKKVVVNEEGRIEVNSPDLHRGDVVEIIVIVNPEYDETEYLLSTEANRAHLMDSLRESENKDGYKYVDPDKL
ncbi:MAG: hypothetical protein M1339_06250 [Bacteroidetes bacterium]|nr:hypothetical protein [Bacteroidota bacterium]